MRISVETLKKLKRDISKKLNAEVYFDETLIKNNGIYIVIDYLKPDDRTRNNNFYADFNFFIVAIGTNLTPISQLMSLESDLAEISFISENVQNIEKYQKITDKLRWGVIWNNEEPEKEVEKNILIYRKTYNMKVFIGG